MSPRIKLFSPTELKSVTLAHLRDMVTAWAPLDAAIQTAQAEKDCRAAEFDKSNEEQFKLETYTIAREHAEGLSQIKLVMAMHPEWFEAKGSREHRTDNAEFGCRKETDKPKVADLDAFRRYADKWGLPLYNETITPIMAAIKKELKEKAIPGVEIKPGELKPYARAIMRNLDEQRKG